SRAKNPSGPSPSEFGHLAVATPGLFAGRTQILTMFGVRPLERVMQPAIRLAKEGYAVDEDYVARSADVLKIYEKYPVLKQSCPYVFHTFLRDGKPWSVGDTLKQPALAHLLEELARSGPEFFYRGPVAEAIEAEMQRNGGLLSTADLASYRARILKPIEFDYRNFHVITMPLPSSGGIALAESLGILNNFDFPNLIRTDPPLAAHYQIEALKHAFADRAQWLGDDAFANVPKTRLLSKSYADSLSRQIEPERTGKSKQYGSLGQPKDAGTSSFSVVDKSGNVVVSTETINTEFGSLVAIDEWGLVLNNEMDDFAAEPDKPNAFGLIQSSANGVAGNKRPLSSMAPTIVLKDGAPYLLLGASGGPRIISAVLNVMLGVLDGGLSLEDAMLRPRPHHQWMPDKVYFDREPNADVVAGLKRRGHEISNERETASVQAILKTREGWIGASDPHKGGIPAGF
ncbi:MAG: gamma-glutamyltransferase, partial [Planctomycetes bacterium]|nr:gamma-glutamyltransferase [Planctomycetota bacterium]